MLGGVVGGFVVVGITLVLKAGMDLASRENTLYVVVVPLLGLAVATLILHGLGRSGSTGDRQTHPWRTFPPDAIRADISGDVIESEGVEERFPWRLAYSTPAWTSDYSSMSVFIAAPRPFTAFQDSSIGGARRLPRRTPHAFGVRRVRRRRCRCFSARTNTAASATYRGK